MTRLITPALVLAAGVALTACSASKDGPKYPQPLPTTAIAKFDLASGALPYPIDLYFAPSASAPLPDGTLNLPTVPWRSAATQTAMNALDGWSTTATLDTGFSVPLDASSINGDTVKIVKVWVNPSTKAPVDPTDPNQLGYLPAGATSPVAGVLEYGVDYTAGLSDAYDAGGKILTITPLKPFEASRGPLANMGTANAGRVLNVGYIVLLTNGLKSSTGSVVGPDSLYAGIKSSSDCTNFTDATLYAVCRLTKAQLGLASLVTSTDPSTVVLTWGFSTQSVDDVLDAATLMAQPQQTLIVPTGLKTSDASALLAGHADIYVGSTQLPYYLTPASGPSDKAAVLGSYWTAAAGPQVPGLDPDSRNLTMFNPMPKPIAPVTVPILVTIPNANSGCTTGMPAGGWPVAIVQHGIGGDRSQALAMSDSFADACFVVVAMDLPLHGITDPNSPLYCTPAKPQCIGATERTFDVDFANNDTGAMVPDGKPDRSGSYFINLSSLLTQRDNLRQAEADLITLTKSLAAANNLVIPPNPAVPTGAVIPVDPTRISFVGLSLGAIVGGSHLHFSTDTRTATLAAPGGVLTKLLLDSDYFGPIIRKGLDAAGAAPGSYIADLFIRDAQAAVDSGDPINHIYDAGQHVALHLMKVLNDTVVPNSATDRLILAGGLRKLTDLGPNPVGPGTPAYTFFSKGYHGSLFDPTVTSPETTVEMQKEAVKFAASAVLPGGPFVVLEDSSVLDLN